MIYWPKSCCASVCPTWLVSSTITDCHWLKAAFCDFSALHCSHTMQCTPKTQNKALYQWQSDSASDIIPVVLAESSQQDFKQDPDFQYKTQLLRKWQTYKTKLLFPCNYLCKRKGRIKRQTYLKTLNKLLPVSMKWWPIRWAIWKILL